MATWALSDQDFFFFFFFIIIIIIIIIIIFTQFGMEEVKMGMQITLQRGKVLFQFARYISSIF